MRELPERRAMVGLKATASAKTVLKAEAALLLKAAAILRDWEMSALYPEQLEAVAAELVDRAK